jgi:hypothetical protein
MRDRVHVETRVEIARLNARTCFTAQGQGHTR